MKSHSAELCRPKAIVCDVGHTIIAESVLNHVLARLGRLGAVRVLYDRNVLNPANEVQIEEWVEQVIREKMEAMHGVEVSSVLRFASQVPLTPGFDQLLDRALANDVPVMLMGAVPTLITEALVAPLRGAISNIAGTEVTTSNGQIDRVTRVCTPRAKAHAVIQWLTAHGIATDETVIIGDSIGDLCAMGLVPRGNRVAFNADDPDVVQFTGRSHRGAMHELSRELFE